MPDNPYQSPNSKPPRRRRWTQTNIDAIVIGTGLLLFGTAFLLAGLWIMSYYLSEVFGLREPGWFAFYLLVLAAGAASVTHGTWLVVSGVER